MSAPDPPDAAVACCDRPFSLTADPRFHFFSRSHRRAFDALMAGLRRGDRLLLVTGDLGVGKTTLGRLLIQARAHGGRAAFVADALKSPQELLRLLLRDLSPSAEADGRVGEPDATPHDLARRLDNALSSNDGTAAPALVVLDEAHALPSSTAREVVALAAREPQGRPRVQLVLAAQTTATPSLPLPAGLDHEVTTRVRVLPLDRDECGQYVLHRLSVAHLAAGLRLDAGAADALHALSGGVPRLVNLIAERAWRQARTERALLIDRAMVETAAAAQAIMRARPKKFRWFAHRAS